MVMLIRLSSGQLDLVHVRQVEPEAFVARLRLRKSKLAGQRSDRPATLPLAGACTARTDRRAAIFRPGFHCTLGPVVLPRHLACPTLLVLKLLLGCLLGQEEGLHDLGELLLHQLLVLLFKRLRHCTSCCCRKYKLRLTATPSF